jgi:hypothetical protein
LVTWTILHPTVVLCGKHVGEVVRVLRLREGRPRGRLLDGQRGEGAHRGVAAQVAFEESKGLRRVGFSLDRFKGCETRRFSKAVWV